MLNSLPPKQSEYNLNQPKGFLLLEMAIALTTLSIVLIATFKLTTETQKRAGHNQALTQKLIHCHQQNNRLHCIKTFQDSRF